MKILGSQFVRRSSHTDTTGKRMVDINGAHYPQEWAREIAKSILKLIGVDNPGKLAAHDEEKQT